MAYDEYQPTPHVCQQCDHPLAQHDEQGACTNRRPVGEWVARCACESGPVHLAQRMASLADDLDYYASKSQPEGYASGLSEAAWKIRKVIDGADPHGDEERAPQDRGCRYCQAHPGEWCEFDCGSPNAALHPDYRPRERVARWLRALVCDAPEDVWERVDPGPREHWRAKADELLHLVHGCGHPAEVHDQWGCTVDISTDRRAYVRCHEGRRVP